jgi:TOTE conflict system, Archaeo-Eukaryotic Primase domain
LSDIGKADTEVFPKQDVLANGISYGNFINAPLFAAHVLKGRSVFLDPLNPSVPCSNQWDFLEQIQRVGEQELDAAIKEFNQIEHAPNNENASPQHIERSSKEISYFGLPPCAQKILGEGISVYQRVVCFRLATHLKRIGMPHDLALALLKTWAPKNRPTDGKRIITPGEIESQAKCAYQRAYRGFGCEEPGIASYCAKNCPLYRCTEKCVSSQNSCSEETEQQSK